jgi:hypothetical protein
MKPDSLATFLQAMQLLLSFLPGKLFAVFFIASSLLSAQGLKTALFVTNRAGTEFNEKIVVAEDFLGGKLAEIGLGVMTRDLIIGNLNRYSPALADDLQSPGGLEVQLSNASSAKRLAETIGADYILAASITGFSERKRNVKAYGVAYTNYEYTLRMSYKLTDANGVALAGGVATAKNTEQNTIYSNEGEFIVVPPAGSSGSGRSSAEAVAADSSLAEVAKKFEQAVGLVVVSTPNGPVPMATAWAVDRNHFATNSHVTEGVREYRSKGHDCYIVLNKRPESVFRIEEVISHPNYGRVGMSSEGREPAAAPYDVGIFRVDGTLPVWFGVAPEAELKKIDSGYRVAYLGFPMEEVNAGGVDPRRPVATMQSGIVTANTDWWLSHRDFNERLLVHHNLSSSGGASGSPVFNTKGQVVALHSAGNYTIGLSYEQGEPSVTRIKSGLQISYAQRADLLRELINVPSTGSASSTKDSAAPQVQVVAFNDPDVSAFVDDMLYEATTQVADSLNIKLKTEDIAPPVEKPEWVEIEIEVETADLYVPDVRIGPENTVNVLDGKLGVAPLDVSVEVDGVAVGRAPGKVKLKPGLSNITLSRNGYDTWQRPINAMDGQKLSVSMQMSNEGIQRWQEMTLFMNALKDGAKLTDAQVDLIRAQAQQLRQSGYKVDIKVDTEDAPSVQNTYKSIF